MAIGRGSVHRAVRVLLGVIAAFWLVVGSAALTGAVDLGVPQGGRIVLGVLALGNGGLFAVLVPRVLRGRRIADIVAGGLLAVNAVLSVSDQIGLLDWASLFVNTVTLILLATAVVGLRAGQGRASDES